MSWKYFVKSSIAVFFVTRVDIILTLFNNIMRKHFQTIFMILFKTLVKHGINIFITFLISMGLGTG